jgi:hypothetical protein
MGNNVFVKMLYLNTVFGEWQLVEAKIKDSADMAWQ